MSAAFTLALAVAVIGPVTVYAVTRDPPMSATESVILRAMVDYAADKSGDAQRVIWHELHLIGSPAHLTATVSKAEWAEAVRYLTNRIGAD